MRCRLYFQPIGYWREYNVMRRLFEYLVKPASGGMKLNLAVALSLGLTVVLLSFQGATSGLQPDGAMNRWVAMGNMQTARSGACSVLLSDGRVLITGGEGAS